MINKNNNWSNSERKFSCCCFEKCSTLVGVKNLLDEDTELNLDYIEHKPAKDNQANSIEFSFSHEDR